MLDRNLIGSIQPPMRTQVDAGQLRFFAKVVGETNPVYFDEAVAKAAGHRGLPAPLTFGHSLRLARPDPFAYLEDLGIDLSQALHGEQHFEYFEAIYAGDTITLQDSIVDIYERKGGLLEFVVWETTATNQFGRRVLTMRHVAVIRK